METQINHKLEQATRDQLIKIIVFIEGEEEFIPEKYKGLRSKSLIKIIEDTAINIIPEIANNIKREIKKSDKELHDLLYPEVVQPRKRRKKKQLKITDMNSEQMIKSLTKNQKLVLAKVIKACRKNNLVRTDLLTPRGKTPYFTGAIITTLIEKKIITSTVNETKHKCVSVTKPFLWILEEKEN